MTLRTIFFRLSDRMFAVVVRQSIFFDKHQLLVRKVYLELENGSGRGQHG